MSEAHQENLFDNETPSINIEGKSKIDEILSKPRSKPAEQKDMSGVFGGEIEIGERDPDNDAYRSLGGHKN